MTRMVYLMRILLFGAFFSLMLSMAFAHEWMAPEKEAALPNPLESSPGVIRQGQTLYSDFCLHCHGPDTRGLAPDVTGLERRPPDLQKAIRYHSDGDFFWKIKTGRGEMPSFESELRPDEIWEIIIFIKNTN